MAGEYAYTNGTPETSHCNLAEFKSGFLIDSMKSGGDVSGMSPIWPKLGQLTRFGLKTIGKPIFLSFITVKVDLELKNCENVKKFQKRFGP